MASSVPGYTALPLRVGERAFVSQLFARQHQSRADDAELPPKRTLLVLNVPLGATADGLAAAFARAGEVTAVRNLGREGGGARSAHVIFAQPVGLKKALASRRALELRLDAGGSGGGSSGGGGGSRAGSAPGASARGGAPSREELQASVDAFMRQFEADEAARQAAEDARHNTMDADGFVVVTRKRTGRSTSTDAASGATVQVARAGGGEGGEGGARPKKKKKKIDMSHFYHFQQHERKRQQLENLREQFEKDKERIARMRNDRKFKPQGY